MDVRSFLRFSNDLKSKNIENLILFLKGGKGIADNLQALNVTSISNKECEVTEVAHDSHLCTLSPRGKGVCRVST